MKRNSNDGKGKAETLDQTSNLPGQDEVDWDEAIDQINRMKQGYDSVDAGQKLGVLQRLVTAVLEEAQYPQALLTGLFEDKTEALLCADAITESKRQGLSIIPIRDRILAQCGVKGMRVDKILEAMSHYTLHTNYTGKPDWQKRNQTRSFIG